MNGKIYKYFNKRKYNETGIKSYYIGQTIHDVKRRAGKNGSCYLDCNTHSKFSNAIKKWGWDAFECEILVENIQTHEELDELEKKYIEEYNSYNEGYNSTIGGKGSSGIPLSEEHKQKMLDGKRRKVYCNELDMTFNSIREAATYVGLKTETSIWKACNGKRNYAGTYNINGQDIKLTWKYAEFHNEEDNKSVKYILADGLSEDVKRKISESSTLKKKVYCSELDMTFNSVKEASVYVGMKTHANISKVCNGKRNYAGTFIIGNAEVKLTWKYID